MLQRLARVERMLAQCVTSLALSACATRDAPPTATSHVPGVATPAAALVQQLAIQLPNETSADTLVTLGAALQLRVTAKDGDGRDADASTVRWTSGDTAVAVINDQGELQVRRSGVVQLAAALGGVATTREFPVILIDGASVREVLDDPLVTRLIRGLSPTVKVRVESALAASAGALNAGAAPTLRTLGANVAHTLDGVDDPADRAVLAILDLYVRQLRRALSLSLEN